MEHSTTLSNDFIKIQVVKYSNSFIHGAKEYCFTAQSDIIADLENFDCSKKTEKNGPFEALNCINNLKFRNNSMRFLFHFCLGTDDCSNKEYSSQEVETELREKEFKYELIFFNESINKEFYEKVSDVLNLDITIIKVSD